MITGPVSSYLSQRLQKKLQQHQVVVWYDSDQCFDAFVADFTPERTSKLTLKGSYFRLRREAEELIGDLKAGASGAGTVLIYVPTDRLDPRCNVLLPLESLGTVVTDSLDSVARDALRGRVPDAKLSEWRKLSLTLEKWDQLAESEEDIGPLDAVFGKVGPRQVAFQFLRHDDKASEVEAHGLLEHLRTLVERTYGVAVPAEVRDARRIRDAFALRVLLHEFLSDLQQIPPELSAYSLPEPPSRVTACRDLAQQLRETKGLEPQYREWADSAVRLFGLDKLSYDAAQLGHRDTFEFEADYALRHVEALVLQDRWEDARTWIEDRSRSFWTEVDQRRAEGWRLARLATDLWLAAERVSTQMPSKKQPPDGWVDLYTAKDGGAWKVDFLLRRLNAGLGVLPPADELTTLIDRAKERAEELEQVQAERFFDSLMEAPGGLAELPNQTDVYAKHIAPLVSQSRTVYVLADAFRFEMAHELVELLTPTGSAQLSFAIATPPTITKVGMAALVPGAEAGITLVEGGDGAIPTVADQPLPGLPQRLKRFEAELGSQVAELALDDCLSLKPAQLEKRCGSAKLLVLRAQELDQIGELDNLHKARTLMGAVIPDLRQAINRLANLGFAEFVICADHGFLLREDISDAMKLDKPTGEVLEVHRRCTIGRHLGSGQHYSVVKASDFGVGGDLELAFPRGINVFKTAGNMVYHHGGLSLQELVVPVLRYTPAIRKDAPKTPSLTLEFKSGKKITNAIFQVALTYQSVDLLDQRRRFRVIASDPQNGKQVGETMLATEGFREAGAEVELESGQTSMLVIKLTDPPSGTGDLELQVADVEAGETILRKKVKYDLAF